MNILFIDTVHPFLQQALEAKGWNCTAAYKLNRMEILNSIKDYNGIVIRSRIKIDKEIIDAGINLKFIARAGAGMENIDSIYAESKGIKCINSPEGNRNAVAEHAMGMLLGAMNKLFKSNAEVRKGIWLREENRGTELEGKTVGIIGFGNTGRAFADKLAGFNVNILVNDPYIIPDSENYPLIRFVDITELFQECDILSLHVPLTTETEYMINASFIGSFIKPVFLINTSRGKVVNTSDVVAALESGKITGAALDVLEFESLSFESLHENELPEPFRKLKDFDNVVLSPHIAGWTYESYRKISEVLAQKIIAAF